MKKIGNRPITEADTDFLRYLTKISETEQNFDEFWNFMSAHFGTVGSTEHWVTVPKCALA